MSFDTVDELFDELDRREYAPFAATLAAYRKALAEQGFNARESFRLVEGYAKFVYDMAFEDFLQAGQSIDEDNQEDDDASLPD